MLPTPKKADVLTPSSRTKKLRLWSFSDLPELVQLIRAPTEAGPRPGQFMDTQLPVPASGVPPPPLPMQGPPKRGVVDTGRQKIGEPEFAPTRPPESSAAQLARRSRPGLLGGLAAADES